VLITGVPSVDSAIKAVEYGAVRYLVKPVGNEDLREVVSYAVRLRLLALAKRKAVELMKETDDTDADRSRLEAQFDRALASLWMAVTSRQSRMVT